MLYKVISKISYEYTGNYQQITLEKGNYLIELFGAQGGCDNPQKCLGGYSAAQISLKSRESYYLYIGGKGEISNSATPRGGFNGGGNGFHGSYQAVKEYAGGGGGATDIRTSNEAETRIIVAGGGGGQGAYNPEYSKRVYYGGHGGGLEGTDGDVWDVNSYSVNGKKGTQQGPGSGVKYTSGSSNSGSLGKGSNGVGIKFSGGGGGAGYYGGSGAYETGGGGGSGYVKNSLRNPILLTGVNQGNGRAIISKIHYLSLTKVQFRYNLFRYLFFTLILNSDL